MAIDTTGPGAPSAPPAAPPRGATEPDWRQLCIDLIEATRADWITFDEDLIGAMWEPLEAIEAAVIAYQGTTDTPTTFSD